MKYSLEEIDGMRILLGRLYDGFGSYSYNEKTKKEEVELRLRTYMMAGITIQDIREKYIKANQYFNQMINDHIEYCEKEGHKVNKNQIRNNMRYDPWNEYYD